MAMTTAGLNTLSMKLLFTWVVMVLFLLPAALSYPVLGPSAFATLQKLEQRYGEPSWPVPAKQPKLANGEWRIEAFYRVLDPLTAQPEINRARNVTLRTREPHVPLKLLLGRPVATEELLAATYGIPDFEITTTTLNKLASSTSSSAIEDKSGSNASSRKGARLQAANTGVAALGYQLVSALKANGVRLSSGPGDEAQSLNVLGQKDPLATTSGTVLYQAPSRLSPRLSLGQSMGAFGNSNASSMSRATVVVGGGGDGGGATAAVAVPPDATSELRIGLQHCPGRVSSYSGAFLVSRKHFLKVDYSIKAHLEGVSMNTFGTADYAMKTSDFRDFHINHVSEWEHWYKRQHGGGGGGGGKSKHRSTSAASRDSSASQLSDANSKKVNHLIDSECRAVPHRKKGARYSDTSVVLGAAAAAYGSNDGVAAERNEVKGKRRAARLLTVEEDRVGSSSSGHFDNQSASMSPPVQINDVVIGGRNERLESRGRRLKVAPSYSNEEDKEEVDERVNGVVLVPFWAGTAKASGGNSHSEASSEAKHQQAAGTICSALKYVKRAVVGTCSTQDSASLKDWLDQRGFGNSEVHQQKGEEAHLVSVWRPAVPLGYGDDINDQSYKEAGNNAYVERGQYLLPFDAISALKDETIQASFDQQFRAHPSMLSSLNATSPAKPSPPVPLRDGKFNLGPSCPPLKQPVPLQPLPLPSSVLIVQFDCFKGVHLPYHLLSGVQALLHPTLGAWRNWSQPLHSLHGVAPTGVESEAGAQLAAARAESGAAIAQEKVEEEDGVDFVYYNEADQVTRFRDLPTARALTSGLLNIDVPPEPTASSSNNNKSTNSITSSSLPQLAPFPTSHHEKPPKGSFVEEFRAKAAQQEGNRVADALAARNKNNAKKNGDPYSETELDSLALELSKAAAHAAVAYEVREKLRTAKGFSAPPSASGMASITKGQPFKSLFYLAPQRLAMRFGPGQISFAERHNVNNTMGLGDAFALVDRHETKGPAKTQRRSYTLTNTCVVCPLVKCPIEDYNTTRRSAAARRANKRNEQRAIDKAEKKAEHKGRKIL